MYKAQYPAINMMEKRAASLISKKKEEDKVGQMASR